MSTKLFPYQLAGAKAIQRSGGRHLLADDMGLGKTIQTLYWLKKRPDARPCVIVCPASLKWNWQHEALKHFGMETSIASGRTPPKRQRHKPEILIINYDILHNWLDYIDKLDPVCLVADECQYLANRTTRRSKAVRHVSHLCRHVILLSGTPIENRPVEFWSALNCAFPQEFPSFTAYAMRYCAPRRNRWGWTFTGAIRLPELHKRIRPLMTRRHKVDVLKDLPEKRREVISLPLSDPALYKEAEEDFVRWYKKTYNKKSKLGAVALQRMAALRKLSATLKMPAAIELLKLLSVSEKVLAFVHHRSIGKLLLDEFKQQAVAIHGGITGAKRQLACSNFQTNDRIRYLFGNMKAAGVGLNLTAASVGVFIEPGNKPAELRQCEDRMWRIGQKNRVRIIYAVGHNTIESAIYNSIQKKQKVLDSIMDGGDGRDDFDIHDMIMEQLLK